MVVTVCVGSACHLKGSHEVITRLQELIAENKLENKIELMASFCLGNCANGVSMTINGNLVADCSIDTIDEIFNNQIIPLL
jgi:NADH:ubiquinone oxidoreductase subunit E